MAFMKIRGFLTVVFIVFLFPASFLSAYASEKEPLIFAGDANFPPVEYTENGEIKGFNIEIIQELAKAMGRPIEIQLMLWKDSQQKVLNGQADALSLLGKEETRYYERDGGHDTESTGGP